MLRLTVASSRHLGSTYKLYQQIPQDNSLRLTDSLSQSLSGQIQWLYLPAVFYAGINCQYSHRFCGTLHEKPSAFVHSGHLPSCGISSVS